MKRRARELVESSLQWASWNLSAAQCADVELLLTGALAPLDGFMVRADAESVLADMCLSNGTPWRAAVTLRVSDEFARDRVTGETIALRDPEGVMLAALRVRDVWSSPEGYCVGGPVEGVQLPSHPDFRALRRSPAEIRAECGRRGWRRVLAFYPDLLLTRAELAGMLRVLDRLEAAVLLLAAVDPTASMRLEHFGRVRSLEAAVTSLGESRAMLALVPVSEQATEIGDWWLRATIAANAGCSDLVLDSTAEPIAAALRADSQPLRVVSLPDMRFDAGNDSYVAAEDVPEAVHWPKPSASDIVDLIRSGRHVPPWMALADVVAPLERSHPRRDRRGFTIFFTGLSGSGKSTIASALRIRLMEITGRPVTLLDGDLVRQHLSSELGFSRADRNLNVLRIGFVASEITRHAGIAICAPIAPYDDVRRQVRGMIEPVGGFLLVHLATPLDVCEARDRKGLYAKARAGVLSQFTGVSDPYEMPTDAAVTLDTSQVTVDDVVDRILAYLDDEGYIDRRSG